MKNPFLRIGLLAATSFSLLTATGAKAETITESTNLREANVELFDLFNGLVNAERLALDETNLPELSADSLYWDQIGSDIDVFFINEGAGYRNQLLYSMNGGEQTLLFEDIASTESIRRETARQIRKAENQIAKLGAAIADLKGEIESGTLTEQEQANKERQLANKQARYLERTESLVVEKTLGDNGVGTMKLGDGKSIGGLSGEIAFDFFLKQDGARFADGDIYGADPTANADGLQHLVARELQYEGDNWVLLGFEDLYGPHTDDGGTSDRDFNDVVLAVRGLQGDRPDTVKVPEPMSVAGLLVFGAMGLAQTRRRQNAS
ncbi:DUF4114 domain-containing protein [cf. Phormidesmis sp. LEGE 11477]|uniref:DUF4114 domain-containing protein n=1 Tax=cf. Phormidesmis sp. LEGE 11477 TaxID=1828680 RepID=UPI00187F26D7|nr:DUF4114 domain-containing protein [cf. Phormidesmis sp. LEGE 11477]MBE9063272.1 DUF4114 domain-containing protein [cf. Phormidesmis sp. LEGE 11477]